MPNNLEEETKSRMKNEEEQKLAALRAGKRVNLLKNQSGKLSGMGRFLAGLAGVGLVIACIALIFGGCGLGAFVSGPVLGLTGKLAGYVFTAVAAIPVVGGMGCGFWARDEFSKARHGYNKAESDRQEKLVNIIRQAHEIVDELDGKEKYLNKKMKIASKVANGLNSNKDKEQKSENKNKNDIPK